MENNVDNVRAQMRKGVLEYCILSILNRGEAYASSILETLKAANMMLFLDAAIADYVPLNATDGEEEEAGNVR